MQVGLSSYIQPVRESRPATASAVPLPALSAGADGSKPVARIDLSRMTPRQLQAYVDDMIAKDRIDPDDAVALFGSIPLEWYDERPDVPIDLNANIKGMADFARDNGYDALAAFYRGLMERMKSMEACSVPLSVIA